MTRDARPSGTLYAQASGKIAMGITGHKTRSVFDALGLFVEGMCDEVFVTPPVWWDTASDPSKTVVGRLMAYPGQARKASGSAGPDTFLKVVRLIR